MRPKNKRCASQHIPATPTHVHACTWITGLHPTNLSASLLAAGGGGGVIGLLWSIALAFMTRAIYDDRKSDASWLMAARLAHRDPDARLFLAAGVIEAAALVCGVLSTFIAISSPVTFLGIFFLRPGLILSASVGADDHFARKGSPSAALARCAVPSGA